MIGKLTETVLSTPAPNAKTEIGHRIVMGDSPKPVPFSGRLRLPPVELIKLFQSLRHALPGQSSHVIQFLSTYHGEGANLIGFEWSIIASTQFGLRVLFVDTAHMKKREKGERAKLANAVSRPLGELLASGGVLSDSQVALEGTRVVYTTLRKPGDQSVVMVDIETLADLLANVREEFDLIVIPAPAITSDILSLSLAKLADASVMVVQAERTRLPVLQRTMEMLESQGAKVIGTVMNRRRFYIPRLIYRWF